jgi:hypothetical protein
MRYLLPLFAVIALGLVGCGGPTRSDAIRIGERTFRIESPPIPGGATGPNRRLAQELCPTGFRILDDQAHKGGADRVDAFEQNTTTIWVIKCL